MVLSNNVNNGAAEESPLQEDRYAAMHKNKKLIAVNFFPHGSIVFNPLLYNFCPVFTGSSIYFIQYRSLIILYNKQ